MQPRNLYELLQVMKIRPGMYFYPPTLPNLKNFLSGYFSALFINNIEDNPLDGFDDFVAQKLRFYESTAGFSNMILAYITGFDPKNIIWEDFLAYDISKEQHQKAIELYYKFLEEFNHEKQK